MPPPGPAAALLLLLLLASESAHSEYRGAAARAGPGIPEKVPAPPGVRGAPVLAPAPAPAPALALCAPAPPPPPQRPRARGWEDGAAGPR